MKSIKKMLLMTAVVAGAGLFAGTQDASAATTYTVVSGDTLSAISTHFFGNNSGVNSIAEANQIADVNLINVGQQLTIPTDGEVATGTVVQEAAPAQTYSEAPAQTYTETQAPAYSASGSDAEAKEWIAQRESGGSYSATNGQYIGRYQLSSSYLNGDYSAANQEAVADAYVAERYGSWSAAQSFWQANGWY